MKTKVTGKVKGKTSVERSAPFSSADGNPFNWPRSECLCTGCAAMYGWEPCHMRGHSLGGKCFGCGDSFEMLGTFPVPVHAKAFTTPQKKMARSMGDSAGGEAALFAAYDEIEFLDE